MGQLAAGLDKLGLKTGEDPERDALIEGLRQENARQLEALRAQQEALRQELAAGSATPALPPAEVAHAARPSDRRSRRRPSRRPAHRGPSASSSSRPPMPSAGSRDPASAAGRRRDHPRHQGAGDPRGRGRANGGGGRCAPRGCRPHPRGQHPARGAALGHGRPDGPPVPARPLSGARAHQARRHPAQPLPRRRARVLPGARRLRGPGERAGLSAQRGDHLRARRRRRHRGPDRCLRHRRGRQGRRARAGGEQAGQGHRPGHDGLLRGGLQQDVLHRPRHHPVHRQPGRARPFRTC